MSTFYVPEMEIFKWNGSFCKFTQINANLLQFQNEQI